MSVVRREYLKAVGAPSVVGELFEWGGGRLVSISFDGGVCSEHIYQDFCSTPFCPCVMYQILQG
jgi:hypothetical protein